MNDHTLLTETAQIVRQLAQFDGAAAMNVVARCYPRFAPAQGGTGLRQLQYEFACDHVPDALAVPPDADEITITLQGQVGAGTPRQEIRKSVKQALGFSNGWDMRAYFDDTQSVLSYQIKVFTTTPGQNCVTDD